MQIIGTVERDVFIVQATADELAKCMGYSYSTSVPSANKLEVGREINVTEAYSTTSNVIGSDRELNEVRERLLRTVAAIDSARKILGPKVALVKSKTPA